MDAHHPVDAETDPRFPSGPWTGFFLDKRRPGRHTMEMILSFHRGNMTGKGRDRVGEFLIRGRYDTADGRCHWTKRYVGKHDVFYQGFNEGKGIWGQWQVRPMRGGFHIWPEGMEDPTGQVLHAAAEVPAEAPPPPPEPVKERELEPVGV